MSANERFHFIDGRRGYFLVVTLEHMEGSQKFEGGFESDCLTPSHADSEAQSLRGLEKAIFWQFCDEQPRGSGAPVRHFVADVPYTKPIPDEARRVELYTILEGLWNEVPFSHDKISAVRRQLEPPPISGTWALCEKFLLERGAEPGTKRDKPKI